MSILNWEDVVEIPVDGALQSRLIDMENLGFPATSWGPFSTPGVFVNISAIFTNLVSQYAEFFKNIFILETSYGTALTRVIRSFYVINRNDAVAARHFVTLLCDAGSGPHPINVGALSFVHPNGSTFRNVEDGTTTYPYTLNSGASKVFLVEAEIAGVKANIANAIDPAQVTLKLQTTLDGVSVIKHELERSGLEEESDVRLIERGQTQWATQSPLSTIEEKALNVAMTAAPAVTDIIVDDTNPRGPGTVDVYAAGLDATASDDDVLLIQVALDLKLFGRRNVPKTCMVYPAPEAFWDLSGTVYFSGSSSATVQAAVEEALEEYRRKIPIGGFTYNPGPANIVPVNDAESVIRDAVIKITSNETTTVKLDQSDFFVTKKSKVLRGDWGGLNYQKTS